MELEIDLSPVTAAMTSYTLGESAVLKLTFDTAGNQIDGDVPYSC